MPLFFFDIRSPASFVHDDTGVEFADIDQVRIEAVRGARGLMAADLQAGLPVDHQQFEIRNEAGAIVLTLRFRDVLTLAGNEEDK